jgi:hypothetical protein
MMIIIITLIREIQEALGGIYVVRRMHYDVVDPKTGAKTGETKMSLTALMSYIWVVGIVLFHCIIGVYLLYASFRRMINVPNDIWGVVESSISAFLVVSIDDAVLYVVLLHPMSKKALEPLGQKSADPSQNTDLAERQEKKDAQGREFPPYPNNPGPPRLLMHNKAVEGGDPQWEETDLQVRKRRFILKIPSFCQDRLGTNVGKAEKKGICVFVFLQLWHPTEHIMTAGGYLILYNYMIGAFLSVATRDTFWLRRLCALFIRKQHTD